MNDLTVVKGVGVAVARVLNEAGIETVEQLAAVDPESPPTISGLRGKPNWTGWVEQAKAALPEADENAATEEETSNPVPEGATGTVDPVGKRPADVEDQTSDPALAGSETLPATNSTDKPPKDRTGDKSGTGDPAGPAVGSDEIEWNKAYPCLSVALAAWETEYGKTPPTALRITSQRDGFRRAGMRHSKAPEDHPLGDLALEDIEALIAEPMLIVALV